ncbi:MAG: hypothetical protein LBD86_07240 [Spirochaetaceae bacterium]|jgi:hypothetical protein|nr:hypothetical protein [Spirochaetaceae bacterium]
MKNYARVLLFFGLCFPILFAAAIGFDFLHAWVEAEAHIPFKNGIFPGEILESGRWALPFTLYLTVVFSINQGRRHKVAWPLIILTVVLLAGAFTFGISKCLSNVAAVSVPPLETNSRFAGRQGLMLSQPGTVITLLDRPSNAEGSRVVAIKDKELIYQKVPAGADGKMIGLPLLPFRNVSNWVSDPIVSDLSLSGRFIAARLDEGLVPYLSWTLSLILLLASLGLVFELSCWPLANIFLGLLVFRGVLAFEVFLNSEETMRYLTEFTRGLIPDTLITSVILASISALVLIYGFLIFLSNLKYRSGKK